MTLHDKSNSTDIAEHTYGSGAFRHGPGKGAPKPVASSGLAMVFAGLIAVLISLMVGHVVVKGVSKAAHFNYHMNGGW